MMKLQRVIVATLFGILLAACGGQTIKPTPATILTSPCLDASLHTNSDFYYGYGRATSLAQARQQAQAHIAEQISVRIASSNETNLIKNETQLQQQFIQQIKSESHQTFTALEQECLDKHSEPGQIHLVLRYDRRPPAQQLKAQLVQQLGYKPGIIHWQAPAALATGQLANRASRFHEQMNSQPLNLPLSLYRTPTGWQLQAGPVRQAFQSEQLPLLINWQALHKGTLGFTTLDLKGRWLNSHLSNGAEYRLVIQPQNTGYLTVIGVYENGQIETLRHNMALADNELITLPEAPGVFEAAALPEQQITTDTFIALVTAQPLNLASLHKTGDSQQLVNLLAEIELLDADVATAAVGIK